MARNDEFQTLAEAVAGYAVHAEGDIEKLKAHTCTIAKKPVGEAITDAVATIGENIQLRRTAALKATNGIVVSYIHGSVKPGMGKIGVLPRARIHRQQRRPERPRQTARHAYRRLEPDLHQPVGHHR